MKKLFILLLSVLSLTAVAQQDVKRVAILETVDKLDAVPYLKRLMFRSNLTSAITSTEGYEGYDRVDISQITGEQDFQRTGMVSDVDIKKIGEFTGAKYVLIAEATIDGEDMFITAKIIDVETARVMRNSNQLMKTSSAEMEKGSKRVAYDLLGTSVSSRMYGECKVGIVNTSQILGLMPEINEAQKKIDELAASYEKTYGEMKAEYEQRFQTYQNVSSNWSSSKKLQEEKALSEEYERLQLFVQTATSDIENRKKEMLNPIQDKLVNAIKIVGKRNGYMYIFDSAASDYMNPNQQPEFEELNNEVLKELNIQK